MAYDEELANRLRELLAGEPDVTEKKMFGGLAFLIGGNMAVAASGQGGVLVRVDPADSDELVETSSALHGDAWPPDAGMATDRRERRPHQTRAREMGETRQGIRALAAG